MAVINLEDRVVASIAARLRPVLADQGIVTANVAELDSVERWRKAARRAGRQLGYPVRTAVSTDGTTVWAVLGGWCLSRKRPRFAGKRGRHRPVEVIFQI